MIRYAAITDRGIREVNEDRVLISGTILDLSKKQGEVDDSILAVICDGVGGEAFGEKAAQLAVQTILEHPQICSSDEAKDITRQMNEAILVSQKKDVAHSNMACTLAAISIFDNKAIIFNVGDSKIYRFRTPYIAQLSVNHTYAKYALTLGLIANESELSEKNRHRITRYLGTETEWQPDIYEGEIRKRDIYLLCSDGLSDVVDDDIFEKILAQSALPETKCSQLLALALKLGSQDNISIIILEVE